MRMTSHTTSSSVSRLEVIQTGARRRWSAAEKLRIVAESYQGCRMVSATARRHGISTGQLFTWRRLARETGSDIVSGFAPAVILDEAPMTSRKAGVMEIEVRDARIVVGADVDQTALSRVLAALLAQR